MVIKYSSKIKLMVLGLCICKKGKKIHVKKIFPVTSHLESARYCDLIFKKNSFPNVSVKVRFFITVVEESMKLPYVQTFFCNIKLNPFSAKPIFGRKKKKKSKNFFQEIL